ncbi:hypothetical protein [Bdellovibrio sp. HCB288]|uniref:hypothetical protein n=1 Tax=Bdellovibrio sp. HCB288 TaxID=3394355 RepID=UPI0039B3DFC7
MNSVFMILLLTAGLLGCQHMNLRKPSSEAGLKPRFQNSQLSMIKDQHVLIVTHATQFFDKDMMATAGIDRIVQEFKSQGRPVIYLVSDQSEEGYRQWYTKDRSPDFEIYSDGGEHNIPISAKEVTIVGGFFGSTDTLPGCHALSMRDAIRMHFELSQQPLTIHVPLRATYFYDEWEFQRDHLLKYQRPLLQTDIPYPFATMYFLREGNNGAGDDGNEQNFAHFYHPTRSNKNYRSGSYEDVSRKTHQFHFYVNDSLFESITDSKNQAVHIKLETR